MTKKDILFLENAYTDILLESKMQPEIENQVSKLYDSVYYGDYTTEMKPDEIKNYIVNLPEFKNLLSIYKRYPKYIDEDNSSLNGYDNSNLNDCMLDFININPKDKFFNSRLDVLRRCIFDYYNDIINV